MAATKPGRRASSEGLVIARFRHHSSPPDPGLLLAPCSWQPTMVLWLDGCDRTPEHLALMPGPVPGSGWALLEHSAHLPCYEEPNSFMTTMKDFTARAEAAG